MTKATKMKKQNIIPVILLSWLCGLACCHLFTGNNRNTETMPDTDYKTIQQKIKETEGVYHQQTDVLLQHNSALISALNKTSISLNAVKKEKELLQETLYRTIRRQELYKKDKDTTGFIANCDSLSAKTSDYIILAQQQDSIHASITGNLMAQLHNRDTMLSLKDTQYQLLRQQFNNSLQRQKLLEDQSTLYRKRIKQQRLGSKLKSAALIILSAMLLKQAL